MYIEREIKKKFERIVKHYPIIALVGARQAGKTTFLKEQMKNQNSSYLLFDDPDIRQMFEEDIKKFENQFIDGKELSVLDEVQYCKDPGRKLKYLADKDKKLWITSSSETILSKKVLSYLVGRVSIIHLYPFSLNEFLKAKNQKELTKTMLERNVTEHCVFGGYPKTVFIDDIETKKIILRDLYETMILKDIARTFSIENINSLEKFVRYLAVNLGGIISYETLMKDLKISFQTTKKYLDAMEKSYLIIPVPPFFKNKLKEITKQPKIYFLDCGLRNAILNDFPIKLDGKLFENYILSELIKKDLKVKYWRTKSGIEVDFVIEKDNELIPVEVKINSDMNIEKNLKSFIEAYRPKKAIIVSYKGESSKKTIGKTEVFFMNVRELIKSL
jgi:uncharacterized protein